MCIIYPPGLNKVNCQSADARLSPAPVLTQALIKMVLNVHFSEGAFLFSPHCGTHYASDDIFVFWEYESSYKSNWTQVLCSNKGGGAVITNCILMNIRLGWRNQGPGWAQTHSTFPPSTPCNNFCQISLPYLNNEGRGRLCPHITTCPSRFSKLRYPCWASKSKIAHRACCI